MCFFQSKVPFHLMCHRFLFYVQVLGPAGQNIQITGKVESQEGVVNFDDIVTKADATVAAAGDVGVEIPTERILSAQKVMIQKLELYGETSPCSNTNA